MALRLCFIKSSQCLHFDILGTVKIKRMHDILDSKTARQFLTTSVRTRRTVAFDNATEECCKEGCTYKEISEYKC